ncbi:MAG: hypothetical protein IJA10_06115 [Lachnospiraceae bacterium]|nr:hypothetical protein [Lachnospiraceae bacterium]
MKLEGSVISIPKLSEYRDVIRKSKEAAREYQYLYHCTSIEGLKGMINSHSFWLSNLQCVNDKEEANRISLPEYEKEYYVGCFTYEDDVPHSHWVEYGNLSDGVLFSVKKNWFDFAKSRFLDSSNTIVEMIEFTEKKEALEHIIGSYIYIDKVDFYKIVYDDELIMDMQTEASIQNGDEVLGGGRFIEPEIIGIIKKRSGMCMREGREAYEKVWEDEKEVRIKLMTASVDGSKKLFWTKRLSVPFSETAFDEINLRFSPECDVTKKEEVCKCILSKYPQCKITILE